jgi:outer membrane protein OmpA-like peptidoglycan-associated protein
MIQRFTLLVSIVFLISCAQKQTKVVLLPQDNGKTGAVTMSTQDSAVTLDRPYTVSQSGTMEVVQADPKDIEKEYGSLLKMELKRPPKPLVKTPEHWPKKFILYFGTTATELTPASRALLPEIHALLKAMPPTRIHVLGFTDTLGDRTVNLTLSLNRARYVADLLNRKDGQTNHMEIGGYGEHDLMVQTPDNTPEPRNRRVIVYIYPGS